MQNNLVEKTFDAPEINTTDDGKIGTLNLRDEVWLGLGEGERRKAKVPAHGRKTRLLRKPHKDDIENSLADHIFLSAEFGEVKGL